MVPDTLKIIKMKKNDDLSCPQSANSARLNYSQISKSTNNT